MHVVALCSQKGGSGKTTLSGHLAVQAELAGAGPVALIDTDPQGSLAAWWNARSGDRAGVRLDHARRSCPATSSGCASRAAGWCVIDTPPAINMAIQRVINVADLVVIPTRPSPHDLRAVAGTVDMVERAQGAMVFVLNAANLRAKITADAVVALSQHGTVAPAFIQQRVDFATSMIDGRTVLRDRSRRRARPSEIAQLWDISRAASSRSASVMRIFQQPVLQGFGRRAVLAGASA